MAEKAALKQAEIEEQKIKAKEKQAQLDAIKEEAILMEQQKRETLMA